MSDKHRSVLSNLQRPSLVQPVRETPAEAEEVLLGQGREVRYEPLPSPPIRQEKVPTAPVTFHLPVSLHRQLKVASQVRDCTMLSIVQDLIERYFREQPLSEQELRKLINV